MEKRKHKSGSLKRKECQEAVRQESAKCCRSIADFIILQPPSTSMSSCATNNQEARNNTHDDDAVTCELQEQERITLNIDTKTSASFTNQPRPSTSSGCIVPVSVQTVLPIVATSEHIASTSDRESDVPSGIYDLVSEAHDVNEPTLERERSTTGIFQYPSRASIAAS
jgi:hypothetical protein